MAAVASDVRVIRRTYLYPHEKRTNFTAIDNDILKAVSSDAAGGVTDKMAKIYLRLLQIRRDSPFFQSEGVACFPGEERRGEWVTGFDQMVEYLGVAAATARKALEWMKRQGIIGYVCPKGYPARIWLNRAATSITSRQPANDGRLQLVQGGAPETEATFFCARSDSGPALKEVNLHEDHLENINPPALKRAADNSVPAGDLDHSPAGALPAGISPALATPEVASARRGISGDASDLNAIRPEIQSIAAEVKRLDRRLAGILPDCAAAVRAEVNDQLEFQFRRMRQHLVEKAFPQAVRVGQQEAYKILRKGGTAALPAKGELYVGASAQEGVAQHVQTAYPSPPKAALTSEQALDLAEAIWTENGKTGEPIEQTFNNLAWQWEATQKYSSEELTVLRTAVWGAEVQARMRHRKEQLSQLIEAADITART